VPGASIEGFLIGTWPHGVPDLDRVVIRGFLTYRFPTAASSLARYFPLAASIGRWADRLTGNSGRFASTEDR